MKFPASDKEIMKRLNDDILVAALFNSLNMKSEAGDRTFAATLDEIVEGGKTSLVNRKNDEGTPLFHLALKLGRFACVEALANKCGDVIDANATDQNGQTALHLAAQDGRANVVKWLVEKGADMLAKDIKGITPLDLAFTKAQEVLSSSSKPNTENTDDQKAAAQVVDLTGEDTEEEAA